MDAFGCPPHAGAVRWARVIGMVMMHKRTPLTINWYQNA